MAPNKTPRQDETRQILSSCLTHLKAEEEALDQLETMLRRNRQALIDHDTNTLVETGAQFEAHRDVSLAIRERRHQIMRTLGAWLRVAPGGVTMSQVVDRLEGDLRQSFTEVQERLLDRVRRLSRLLQENTMIAVQHNLIINQTMAALTGQTNPHQYGASGRLQSRPASAFLEAEL